MSKVKMTVKPSQGSKLDTMPKDLTIGTEITAIGEAWNYRKGEAKKNGEEAKQDSSGQVVEAATKRFVFPLDKLADDLIKGSYKPKDLTAAGIKLAKKDNGEVEIEIDFPCTTVGIAAGKFCVAKS